jgi:hypothetical protein
LNQISKTRPDTAGTVGTAAGTISFLSCPERQVSALPGELRLAVCNPMTSQERIRLAQRLNRRAKDPRLSAKERHSALRHACNLVRINLAVAEREGPGTAAPKAVAKSE